MSPFQKIKGNGHYPWSSYQANARGNARGGYFTLLLPKIFGRLRRKGNLPPRGEADDLDGGSFGCSSKYQEIYRLYTHYS